MAKLSLLLLSLVSGDVTQCPSTDCWTWNAAANSGAGACELKTSDGSACDYGITCTHTDGMTVTMNNAVFGSTENSDFDDAGCNPVWSAADSEFTWQQALGTCGQTLVKDGNFIIFTKEISLGGTTDPGVAVTNESGTSINLYTSIETSAVTVTFKCKFAATATATSTQLGVKPHTAVSGVAAEAAGDWTGSMTLKYFTDNTFATQLESDEHSVFMGATMYVASTWSVTSLSSALRYYIEKCTVKDVSSEAKVAIVDGTCYASAVGAEALGDAAGDTATSKIVEQTSQFKYTSFSFDTAGNDAQELECTVNFCVVDSGSNDGGATDCPNVAFDSGTVACPTTAGFSFTP